MNAKTKLLDSAKKMCTPQTDAAIATQIGVTKAAVSLWRKGGTITETHATALAALAKMDGEIVIAVLLEQSASAPAKAVWKPLLDRLSAAAAVVALVVLAPLSHPAKALENQGLAQTERAYSVYYVQCVAGTDSSS